jgi:hypothetical protein
MYLFNVILSTVPAKNATSPVPSKKKKPHKKSKKAINFKKWFSKRLFLRAKHKFERSEQLNNQANSDVNRANSLVSGDTKMNSGEKISSEFSLDGEIMMIFGSQTDLSEFGQFISGYFVGDSANKIEKGYLKTRAQKTLRCLKENYEKVLSQNSNVTEIFVKPMMTVGSKITPDIVEGVKMFFTHINKVKSLKTFKKRLGTNLGKVNLFFDMISYTVVNIAKYVHKPPNSYTQCFLKAKIDKPLKSHLEKKRDKDQHKSDVNIYNCFVSVDQFIEKIIYKPVLVTVLHNFWDELIKNGLIEKKWDIADWNLIGKSAGQLVSQIVRPICRKGFKKRFMNKWHKRLFKNN